MDRQRKSSGGSTGSYSRSNSAGGVHYDDRGPRGYSGRGNGGGRGGRPRQHDRQRGGRGGGNGGGGRGHPGMNSRPPVILTREKRPDHPAPGAVSIMQRETSGSHIPTSTTGLPIHPITSPGLLPTPVEPVSPGPHQPPSSLPQVSNHLCNWIFLSAIVLFKFTLIVGTSPASS